MVCVRWDSEFCSYPLSSCPWPGTSGSGSTGSGSSGVCPPDSPYCLCMCSSSPSSQCAWKSPCSPRSCTRHSACLEKEDKVMEVEDFSQPIGEPKFDSVIILLLHKCYIIKSCFWLLFAVIKFHINSQKSWSTMTWLFTTCTLQFEVVRFLVLVKYKWKVLFLILLNKNKCLSSNDTLD